MEEQSIISEFRLALEENKNELQGLIMGKFQELKDILKANQNQRDNPDEDMSTPDQELYKKLEELGSGSSGAVYEVRDPTGVRAAMKVIQLDKKRITKSLSRELSIMFELEHDNIVRLDAAFVENGCLCLIMEFVSWNMMDTLALGNYKDDLIKEWMKQMLSAVAYLHNKGIMHRDLKPQNILIMDDESKTLKVGDFGTARGWFDGVSLTPQVTTPAYRAPEILLGCVKYTSAVDMWSIGCIMAELASKEHGPLFEDPPLSEDGTPPKDSDHTVIGKVIHNIFKKVGTPTEESWPGVSSLLNFPSEPPTCTLEPSDVCEWLDAAAKRRLGADGQDLLRRLLCLNPERRITAQDALKHPYFV